ncbi:MAG: aspartate-semialdehyde dehydrogenase [Phycisphaerales bacterium]
MDRAPNIAVVGATGAVGRECLSILEQRGFAHGSIRLLASARSAGTRLRYRGTEHEITELGPQSFEGVDLAFFAAGSGTSREFVPRAVAAGCTAIDKSSAHRSDPAATLAIPEVNRAALAGLKRGAIIAVPNCSTIILLIAVEPLRRFGIERIVVSTYQAASGAGAAAMQELEDQTRDVLAGKPAVPRVFAEPCAFNVFSHDSTMDSASGLNAEEAKFTSETRRLWSRSRGGGTGNEGEAVWINATCVRVPVMRGHSESVCLTLRKPISEGVLREAFAGGESIRVVDDRAANRFPTPLNASGGDEVLVGRIRPDVSQGVERDGSCRGWNLFISGDQLRLGAALTAVKIAEELARRGT